MRGDGPEKTDHDWQQGESEARRLVEMFSQPGNLVVDPMLGSGTNAAACIALGRRFVGSDIDPAAVATSRERIRFIVSG